MKDEAGRDINFPTGDVAQLIGLVRKLLNQKDMGAPEYHNKKSEETQKVLEQANKILKEMSDNQEDFAKELVKNVEKLVKVAEWGKKNASQGGGTAVRDRTSDVMLDTFAKKLTKSLLNAPGKSGPIKGPPARATRSCWPTWR